MKRIKQARFALPNLVTLGSVFCAMLSMSLTLRAMPLEGEEKLHMFLLAALAVLGSIIFDLFDGKIARWTHTSTKFGMELDSLADGVSFGISPAVLMYGFALHHAGWFGLIACFLYACGALLRLARFNIEAPDEGVQTLFKGIPSPAGAAGCAAIVLACLDLGFTDFTETFKLYTLGAIIIFLGILMVSSVNYKTLKGKKTPADYAVVIIGVLFFAAMSIFKTPSIAFLCLFIYFVMWGFLLSIYLNLRRKPARSLSRMNMAPIKTAKNSQDASADDSTEKPE